MPNIEIASPLIPGAVDTPLDPRTRVQTFADIASVEVPYIGMEIYVAEINKKYRVISLKAKTIGALSVDNAAVDQVEEVGIQGAQGEPGPQGPQGPAGAKGDPGETASGSANVVAGSSVPILAYAELVVSGGTQYVAYVPEDTDLAAISSGSVLSMSLQTPDESTLTSETVGSETVISAAEDKFQSATVLSATSGAVFLSASLLNSVCSSAGLSSSSVSYTKLTVSGGTATQTHYRATLSGADSIPELYPGRRVYTRAGSGILRSNSVDHVSGNYLFLGTEASGTTAVFYGQERDFLAVTSGSSAYIAGNRNFVAENDAAFGEYNIVLGLDAAAHGACNSVHGDFSFVFGATNSVRGDCAFAAGNNNTIADGGIALGATNSLLYQGEFAVGNYNTLTGIGAITIGAMNSVSGYASLAVGNNNSASGQMNLTLGNRLANNAGNAVVIGYGGTVSAEPRNSRSVIFFAGTASEEFAIRSFRNEPNPLYDPSLDASSSGKDLNGENAFLPVEAHRISYRGQISPATQSIPVSGDMRDVVLDCDLYSRFELTGSGSASLDLDNAQDGDRVELILHSDQVSVVFPAEWITLGVNLTETPGLYVLEIAKIGTSVFYKVKYPDSQGGGSIGDRISIVDGYWHIDGVNTGVSAIGTVDSAGNVSRADTVTSAGTVTSGTVTGAETVSSAGNVTSAGTVTSGTVTSAGTVTSGTVTSAGTVSSAANIESAGTVVTTYNNTYSGASETRVIMTQASYDALETKDENTWYYIREN